MLFTGINNLQSLHDKEGDKNMHSTLTAVTEDTRCRIVNLSFYDI